MNKCFFITCLMISFSCFSTENSCEVKGYTVGFFNGVKTTYDDAKLGLKSLRNNISLSEYNGEEVDYQLFYNDSRVKESDLFLLVDLAETFDQRTKELDITSDAKWEAFWDIISERNNSGILNRIYNAVPDFLDFIRSEFNSYINAKIRNFLYELSGSFGLGLPNTEEVTMKHNLINDSLTWQGKKLIYIAHSQGNLWVNQAYNNVLQQQGYSSDNIKAIHIAPASTDVNGDYILSTNDEVINGLRIAVGEVMWPNITAEETENDSLGHGLTEVYLADPDTKEMILKSVNNAFASLVKPEMEDYLFEMTYDYTPNFVATHSAPDIKIVNNITDPDGLGVSFAYGYLSYESGMSRLTPMPGIETVYFEHDNNSRDQSIVQIIQCIDIPNEDDFILGEYSAADKGLVSMWPYLPPNIETHITVRDRYGVLLQQNKVSYNENRDRGWAYLTSLIGFRAEHSYTDSEKAYLEKNNLNGKYSLYSDLIHFSFRS